MKTTNVIVGLAALLILAGISLAVLDGEREYLGPSQDRFEVTCEGVIEVDAFGLGKPALDPTPYCTIEECSWYDVSWSPSALAIFGDSGRVSMDVQDSSGTYQPVDMVEWKSLVGGNPDFTLKSGCRQAPIDARIVLFSADNAAITDTYEVTLQ